MLTQLAQAKKEDGTPLYCEKEIGTICSVLMLGGRDTTAGTISFFIAEMVRNPDVYARLMEEIDAMPE